MEINSQTQNANKNKRDRDKRFLFYKEDVSPVPF